jgi:hypothetical protein
VFALAPWWGKDRDICPVKSMAVTRNWLLILLNKVLLLFKLGQIYIKKILKFQRSQICAYFLMASVAVELLAIVQFFTK